MSPCVGAGLLKMDIVSQQFINVVQSVSVANFGDIFPPPADLEIIMKQNVEDYEQG